MIYFDLPTSLCGPDARCAILPVPYERTTSYGKGAAEGPAAILEASQQVELYDDELRRESADVGIQTLDALNVDGTPDEVMTRIENAVDAIIARSQLPIVLGGEHSVTPPAVRAVARHSAPMTVLQLDAHADLRDSYEGTPLSHACAMARVREICPTVQVGIRSLSSPEAEAIERDTIPVFFAREMHGDKSWMERVLDAIATDAVYITIDVDALDPAMVASTGTPEPGGMTWYQTLAFLRKVMGMKRVVGLDIVELAPRAGDHASDFAVAKLLYKCIGYATN